MNKKYGGHHCKICEKHFKEMKKRQKPPEIRKANRRDMEPFLSKKYIDEIIGDESCGD